MELLEGTSIVDRVAIGPALVHSPLVFEVGAVPHDGNPEAQMGLFASARDAADAELAALGERLRERRAHDGGGVRGGDGFVFAQREMLHDEEVAALVEEAVREGGLRADSAVAQVFDQMAALFAASGNETIAQRALDLRDVRSRILRCLNGIPEADLSSLERPCVIVARELFPSQTLSLDRDRVLGIATEGGGAASHTAIIARSLDVAAVIGVEGLLDAVEDGATLVVDGVRGVVAADPSHEELRRFAQLRDAADRDRELARAFEGRDPVTPDGVRVAVKANVAELSAADAERAAAGVFDGVGLLRSEFLFLGRPDLPGEDEQFDAYRRVLGAFGGRPVVLRTIDFGADKQPEALPVAPEGNPALGQRGIRLALSRPDLFATQVRAALRASALGPLKIMFPMVTSVDEFRAARAFVQAQGAELDARGVAWNRDVPIGAMIETPALALMAEEIAREADFASVGTNDLVQYLCAADRLNAAAATRYQQLHPALLRVLAPLARAFEAQGKELCVCGELAGDHRATALLVGLGIRSLSMDAHAVPRVKRAICATSVEDARELARAALCAATEQEVRDLLQG